MTRIRSKMAHFTMALVLAATLSFRPSTSQATIGLYHGGAMVLSPLLSYGCAAAEMKILCVVSGALVLFSIFGGMAGMAAPDEAVSEAEEQDWQQVRAHFEPAFNTVREEVVKKAFHQTRRGASVQEVEQTLRLGELLN